MDLKDLSDKDLIALKQWNPPEYAQEIVKLFGKDVKIESRLFDRSK